MLPERRRRSITSGIFCRRNDVDLGSKFTAVNWGPSSRTSSKPCSPQTLVDSMAMHGHAVYSSGEVGVFRAFLVFRSFRGWTSRNTRHMNMWIRESVWASRIPCQATAFLPLDRGDSVWTFRSYTSAVAQSNWFSSCQNASTNESSVDDVVDLAVTRLSASTFSARSGVPWASGARGKDGNWCPSLRRVKLASTKALFLAFGEGSLGRSPSHQRYWDFRAFESEWNPFLNSVNTILDFSCQTGKRRRRCAALPCYWGSGAEPQPPTLLGAFGCKMNPFLNSPNTIFNSACQTGKGRSALLRYRGV